MDALESVVKTRVAGKFVECNTLEIIACNAFTEPFSAASILTQEKLCTFRFAYDLPETFTDSLPFDYVWDVKKLEDLMKQETSQGEEKRIKVYHDKDIGDAFAVLAAYITDIHTHEECLKKVLRDQHKPEESAVVRVLAAHLFGPLSNGNYEVDNHIPNAKVCSSGCGREVKQGNTGLGCDITWHGYVDMYVQERIPMSVVANDSSPEDSENTPAAYESDEECWRSVEVKKDEESFSIHKKGSSQLIAQTITNGFAQVNKNKKLSGLPIPSFGCSPKQISIISYDCKNDILLKSLPLSLFVLGKLDPSTIVMIWLYLHFFLFMNKNVSNQPTLSKANFLKNEWVNRLYSNVQSGLCSFGTPSERVIWTPKSI